MSLLRSSPGYTTSESQMTAAGQMTYRTKWGTNDAKRMTAAGQMTYRT